MPVGRSVMRVLVAVGVFSVSGLVWSDLVRAAGHDIDVSGDKGKCDKTWGPPCFSPANGTVTPVTLGETVTWHVLDGTHTVTPVDGSAFTGSGDLTGPGGTFSVTFDRPGVYTFYCQHHGQVDSDGKTFHGMWGKIDVKGGDTTASSAPPAAGGAPPGPPPSDNPGPANPPPPSQPGSPPPGPSSGSGSGGSSGSGAPTAAGSGRPYVGPPPTSPPPSPAARTASGSSSGPSSPPTSSKPKDGSSTDTTSPSDATAVPPDEAVLPPSPTFSTPTTTPVADAPGEAPHGDTVALLKSAEPGGHRRKVILVGLGLGIGGFVAGVGGWKWTHRASKYWPA